MALNKVMLIGNVGKDPEVRFLETPEHPKVAQFTLATTERYKAKDGSISEQTEWHNIVAWRGLADIAEKYIHKGSPLYVEGRLRTRSWEAPGGQTCYRTEIVADGIQMLGSKPKDGQGGQAQSQSQAQTQSQAQRTWEEPRQPRAAAAAARPVVPAYGMAEAMYEDPKDDLPF